MGYVHLTYTERLIIEKLYPKHSVSYIASVLSRHRTTIYKELQKGKYMYRNSDYTEELRYSADIGQSYHDYQQTAKGIVEKVTFEMLDVYKGLLGDGFRSVRAAVGELKHKGIETVSHSTLYRYIDNGYIECITLKHRRKASRKPRKLARRAPVGASIEIRPKDINERNSFGHWEMDCVVGSARGRGETMLVLSERLTRFEIIWKMQSKHARSVVSSLRAIVSKYGNIFKTITVDNGSEFSDYYGMKKYTGEVYYCHPYSSWERGTNENINRMIRWKYPKKTSFKNITNRMCNELADWINNYPRTIFNGGTAKEQFDKYVKNKAIISTA